MLPDCSYILDGRKLSYDEFRKEISEDKELLSKYAGYTRTVPELPFSKTWHELAFRRAMRYAAENGYGALTWATGEQQSDRYDLSRVIDSIDYQTAGNEPAKPDGKVRLWLLTKGGEDLNSQIEARIPGSERGGDGSIFIPTKELPDVVGKEITDKILAQHGEWDAEDESRKLSGVDLKVGGEGMRGFYDKILPDFARRYGKKWGATVGTTEIPVPQEAEPIPHDLADLTPGQLRSMRPFLNLENDASLNDIRAAADEALNDGYRLEDLLPEQRAPKVERVAVHSITITPAMRESVMQGQPLFSLGQRSASAGISSSFFITKAQYRAGVLWVNQQTMDHMAGLLGEPEASFAGVHIPPTRAADLLNKLIDYKSGQALRALYRLASGPLRRAIAEAIRTKGSVVAVVYDKGDAMENLKAVLRHELFHEALSRIGGTARGQILLKNPLALIAAHHLGKRGYDREDDATMWAEIGAHLAAGPVQWKLLGLNNNEAVKLFAQYLRLVDDATLARLKRVAPQLKETVDAARREFTGELHSAGRGQQRPESGRQDQASLRGSRRDEPEFVRLDREAAADEEREGIAERLRALPREQTAQVNLGGITRFLNARFGDNAPEANYSGLGAAQSRYIRNLSQTEMASLPAHTAGIRAAASRAQSAAILRAAVPAITKALEGSGVEWAEMRLALIQGRLEGIRDRWQRFATEAAGMSDVDLQQAFTDHFASLLDAMEGKQGLDDDILQTATALAETKDWDTLRDYLDWQFSQAADAVGRVMDPGRFTLVTSKPEFRDALSIYKRLVEQPMAENHALNEGVFSDSLGPLDTYYPLIPVERPTPSGPGRRLPYHKPRNMANSFATGLAEGYESNMEALRDRLMKAVRSNDKASLVKTLEEEGLLQPATHGQKTVEVDGREYEAERVEIGQARQIIKDGKSIFVPARTAMMPRWLARELAPILEAQRFDAVTTIEKVMRAVNTFALAGPADFVFHSSNVLGSLVANTPFLANTLVGKATSVPLIKKFAAIAYVLATDPTTPEAAADIIEMAKVGALPDRYASVTFSKRIAEEIGAERVRFSFSPMLYGPRGLDVRARLLLWRLAKSINPGATPQELYHFVNQLGNYVPALQGEVERALKASGWSPFYTAGSTMIRNGINAWSGMGPMPKTGLGLRLAQQLTGGALSLIAMWAITYHFLTGQWPWKDKRAKFLQIPVGSGHGLVDQYRHSKLGNALWGNGPEVGYINFNFFDPLIGRGARAMGIPGAFETHQLGGSGPQQIEAAQRDILNSFAHPVMGPPARASFVGIFNREPYLTGMRDTSGNPGPQLFPASPKELKPGFLGGLAPALYPNTLPRRKAGFGAETGARIGSTFRELNAFYGNLGETTGFLGSDKGMKGNGALRMMFDLALPGLVSNATNPYGRARSVQQQRRAMGQ